VTPAFAKPWHGFGHVAAPAAAIEHRRVDAQFGVRYRRANTLGEQPHEAFEPAQRMAHGQQSRRLGRMDGKIVEEGMTRGGLHHMRRQAVGVQPAVALRLGVEHQFGAPRAEGRHGGGHVERRRCAVRPNEAFFRMGHMGEQSRIVHRDGDFGIGFGLLRPAEPIDAVAQSRKIGLVDDADLVPALRQRRRQISESAGAGIQRPAGGAETVERHRRFDETNPFSHRDL
jgi:hypothetical protein